MGFIPEHIIDQVRDRADIVEIVSLYVSLQRKGTVFRGLCPFHAEKTPSFTVNPERRIFHCFGCGVGGNVFRFLMLQKGISFPEAVGELAERYGVELPRSDGGRRGPGKSEKKALYDVVARAEKFFQEELEGPGGRTTREYLERRGIGPEIIREYRLGWAPDGWDHLRRFLESHKVPPRLMEQAGLVKPRSRGGGWYDTFRGRVITPIFDLDGRTVAFGGRLLENAEGQPKYINSPETPIYSKGRLLYGLDRSRKALRREKKVLIVEGYFDLLSLAAHGVDNVAATLGTALTESHLRLLKGYVQEAVMVFDADDAGRAAAARTLPLFISADIEARVLSLPDGHDPDSFVRSLGPGALREKVANSAGLVDFYIDQTLARHPDTLAGKSRAAQEVMGVINRVEGAARVELLRRKMAERLGVSEQAITPSRPARAAGPSPRTGDERTIDFETEVIRFILLHQGAAGGLLDAGLEECFTGERMAAAYGALARQFQDSGRVDIERLEGLDPETMDLLTGLALSEDGLDEQTAFVAAGDYLEKFEQRETQDRLLDLSRRIKSAQSAGDESGLMRLLEEKTRLLRK